MAPADPRRVVPTHVRHCYETGARDWWVYTWKHATPNRILRTPYRCNSWRCPGCARHENAVTFARIKEATSPLEATGFVYLVLTLDRAGYYSGEKWRSATEAFRALGKMTGRLLKRLRRWHARKGWPSFGSRWVATVEAHRSGWPHVNILVHAPELATWLRENQPKKPDNHGCRCRCRECRESILVRDVLRSAVVGSGWGVQSTAEPVRDADAVNGYLVKLAGEAGQAIGEVAKLCQLPYQAPARFRRLRAGKGFLPPRRHDPTVTGTLVRRMRSMVDGTVDVTPVHRELSSDRKATVERICSWEEQIAHRELTFAAWNARMSRACPVAVVRTPPVLQLPGSRAPPPGAIDRLLA